MDKSLSKNLQNIERNKSVNFGVCKCYLNGDKKLILRKMHNWNLQMHIYKV